MDIIQHELDERLWFRPRLSPKSGSRFFQDPKEEVQVSYIPVTFAQKTLQEGSLPASSSWSGKAPGLRVAWSWMGWAEPINTSLFLRMKS